MKKLFFAVTALAMAFAISPAASASSLCPSSADTYGYGSQSFVAGAACAETMSITNSQDYARLRWNSSNAGYPAGLTFGNLGGITSNVTLLTDGTAPYYMLAFTNSSDSFLSAGSFGHQILFIEFQCSTVSGNTMALDPSSTLFNLYDNDAGTYLRGGQQDTHTLAEWLALDSKLSSDQIQEIRLAIGMAGGPGQGESLTVNSVDVTKVAATPEPSSLLLLGTGLAGIGGFVRRRFAR